MPGMPSGSDRMASTSPRRLADAAIDVIGLQHAHPDAQRRADQGEEQAVHDRLLGEVIVERDVFVIAQRQRRRRHLAGPDAGERHHQERDHWQHHAASDVDGFQREGRGAAAGAQRDGARAIALARHRLEPPAVDVAALHHRDQDGEHHHHHAERGGAAEIGRVLHELEDFRRHGADAMRGSERQRHVEQPRAGDEDDERGRHQRRREQRQGDEAQRREEPGAVHPRGVLQRRIHLPHRRDHEQVDIGRVEQRQHPGGAADRVDRDEVAGQAEGVVQEPAQDSAVGRCEIDPADGAHIGGEEERHQVEHLEPAPSRHVGARHHPGEAQSEHAADDGRADAAQDGVASRLVESGIGEQPGEILHRQRRPVGVPIQHAADDRRQERPEDQRHADDDAGGRQRDFGEAAAAPGRSGVGHGGCG